jgi:NAD-dependent dihydropyrimidine dehydrogenase PreA subunit
MAKDKVYAIPNITTPNRPVIFNPEICNGCNQCVEIAPWMSLYPILKRENRPSFSVRMNAGTVALA